VNGEIKAERNGPILTITISRPDKLNSVTAEMLDDFTEKVSKYTNDPDITAIIFTGEGEKAFSAGFDLKLINGLQGPEKFDFFKRLEMIIRNVRQARHSITMAAVNGYAIGFGAMVAGACDFRFFSENGAYRLPEIDIGVFPGAGAASNLIQLVGPSIAKDILMSGRMVAAAECYQIGLANRIIPPNSLMQETTRFVEDLIKKDRSILLRTKSLVDAMTGRTTGGADETESTYLEEWLREL